MKNLFFAFLLLCFSAGFAAGQKPAKGSVSKARAALKKDELAAAKAEIDRAFEIDKKGKVTKDPNAWHVRGRIYKALAVDSSRAEVVDRAALDEAVKCFDKSAALSPSRYAVFAEQEKQRLRAGFFSAGAARYAGRDFAGAAREFENSLRVVPEDSQLLLYAGVSASVAGLRPQALRHYQALIARFGADKSVWMDKIALHQAGGDTLAALRTARGAIGVFPDDSHVAVSEIRILLAMEKKRDALRAAENSIERNPGSPTLRYAKGFVCASLGNDDGAAAAYRAALELRPDYYEALLNLGLVYYERGRRLQNQMGQWGLEKFRKEGSAMKEKAAGFFRKALPYFERARAASPKGEGALEALRNCYKLLGMKEKAQAAGERLDAL